MAVDIFEELVKAYLQQQGYFTIENVPLALPETCKIEPPYRTDPSDIDIIAIAPRKKNRRVLAVSCKGSRQPFNPKAAVEAIEKGGKLYNREAWRCFRELAHNAWATAFRDTVFRYTGETAFHHVTAIGTLTGAAAYWANHLPFRQRMGGQALLLLPADRILEHLMANRERMHPQSGSARLLDLVPRAA